MSTALSRYNLVYIYPSFLKNLFKNLPFSEFLVVILLFFLQGSVMESYTGACFPGCEVPEWFRYKDYGSKIEKKLAKHRSENRFIGIALCAAVSFQDYQDQIKRFHTEMHL